MTLAGQVIDFYDDTDHSGLRELAEQGEGLDKYASYSFLDPEQLAALPDDQFALVVLTKHANIVRKFPVNDDGNAWLSVQYFDMNHDKLSLTEKVAAASNLRDACLAHEIDAPPSIVKYAADGTISNTVTEGMRPIWWDEALRKQAEEELTKTASAEINARMELPDSAYALILDHEGDTARMYAMPDENHVKIASAYFKKHAMDLAPEHRHTFAVNVMNRARELGVELEKTAHLEKWASDNYSRYIDHHIEQRRSLLPRNQEAQDVLGKLAALRDSADPNTFAQALHEFDKTAGLDKYYDKGVADPWSSSMELEKTASWNADIDGGTLTAADLQKVAQSGKLKSHFGEAFHNQFAKHAVQIFESLPTPEKVVIAQIARGQI